MTLRKQTAIPRKSPVADALRKAGFVPLPRLWVRPADLAEVLKIARRRSSEVNAIRGQANRRTREKP